MPVQYVNSTGGVFRRRVLTRDDNGPEAPALRVLRGDDFLTVIRGPGHVWHQRKDLCKAKHKDRHDLVLVDDVKTRWYSQAGLIARLYGTRLVDNEWLRTFRSSEKAGECIHFQSALAKGHFVIYISAKFRDSQNIIYRELVEATSHAGIQALGIKRLEVHDGLPPDHPRFPMCTWTLLADGESAPTSRADGRALNFCELCDKLSFHYR